MTCRVEASDGIEQRQVKALRTREDTVGGNRLVAPVQRRRSVPFNKPLDALVSCFKEEVRREADEEERNAAVQLLVDLFGLDIELKHQRGPAEQSAMELRKHRFRFPAAPPALCSLDGGAAGRPSRKLLGVQRLHRFPGDPSLHEDPPHRLYPGALPQSPGTEWGAPRDFSVYGLDDERQDRGKLLGA
ncbi:unnamed protein product [Pleuronectes platessa]|uniref:Uncharacterized protein n=1 Tax=Pleuronectes platessa TaxID=8262 RepID=A0A9N7YFZ9_PLEPL|nr:unnamed protein product [Pleuronectes platessa]